MNWLLSRVRRDESGASLIFAIVFMVVAGAIAVGLVNDIATTSYDRANLDKVRNTEYAADGAIETAIAQVRTITAAPGIGFSSCGGPYSTATPLDGVSGMKVYCQNAPTLTQGGFLQRDVVFTACISGSPCTPANTVIRAEVNFEAITQGNGSLLVTNTTVESWSVNA